MFTLDDLRALLNARPFVAFRLHLSDGGHIDVRHREFVMAGRRYAVVALPEPTQPDAAFDRNMVVWYFHVARAEQLDDSSPPFTKPPSAGEAPSPAPA
jgi:hypothetical protein